MANTHTTGTGRKHMIIALFRDKDSAEQAYRAASDRGYSRDDVNVVMSDDTRKSWFPKDSAEETELGNKALEGTGAGAAIGGVVGGTLAAIAAIGTSLVMPGLGLIVAGPLAAGLAGAGAGGLTGGLIGALVGWGIPEEHAKTYEEGVRQGGLVMGVKPRSDEDAAHIQREWKTSRGEHIAY